MSAKARPPVRRAHWLWALAAAVAMTSAYPAMRTFRAAWRDHYPTVFGALANNGPFAVVGWFGTEMGPEELGYAARVNDLAHHVLAFDPYIKESRSRREFVTDRIGYGVLAALRRATGDINAAWIWGHAVCALAWFLCVFWIVEDSLGSPALAVFAATFVTAFSYLLTFLFVYQLEWSGGPAHVLLANAWHILSYGRTEGILRMPRPGVTYALQFLATAVLLRGALRRSAGWLALGGALGGALAYVHLDSWTVFMSGAAAFALVCAFRDRELFAKLLLALIVAAAVSAPFVYANYPANPELVMRGTYEPFAPPRFEPFTLIYAAAFVLVLLFRRKTGPLLIASMALGTMIAIHGVSLAAHCRFAPDNWEYIGNIFLFLAAISFVPRSWIQRPRPWLAASAVLLVVAFLQGVSYAAIHFPFQGLPRDYASALEWLDRNTPADSEVLSVNPEVNGLIAAYTHDKTEIAYVAPVVSDYPTLANYERFLGGVSLLHLDRRRLLAETLDIPGLDVERRTFEAEFRRGVTEKRELQMYLFLTTPEPEMRRIMREAEGHAARIEPDYVWVGDFERQYAPKAFPPRGSGLREVFRSGSVVLYARG